MQTHSKTPLCSYHYDALDRLVDCKLSGQESARRFYQKDRLATEINSTVQHSIMQHDDHLLAQQQRQTDAMETRLLATDQQRSVLSALNATTPRPVTYTPYGHRPLSSGLLSLLSLLGFNGERPDPVTGHYLLGNGYRAFNPVLMRFNSPDSLSPFGKGGLNAYSYCEGNPVSRRDPNGHWSISGAFNWLWGAFTRLTQSRAPTNIAAVNRPAGSSSSIGTVASRTGTIDQRSRLSDISIIAHRNQTPDVPQLRSRSQSAIPEPPVPAYPNLGPEDWLDLESVFQIAPYEATQEELTMVLNQTWNNRQRRSSPLDSIVFLNQFVRD
ncbi:RHS repeat-associated core domain-containing protein [Pseudomonas sp. p50]|uniref:RHS repeat-associated core domain-containing protein n=1 Tax=Pseudomonas sp. p50(2008) TaxID=2816832 RepID=UPI00188AF715|nr:RHS repeat-associated core domain-containing protein [Pseudomonas sp. p50(2008)]MBF4556068.1 RHS repeat-associated core domain-containing protein [Pseudomonas sp. p50(2008)]